MKEYEKVYEDLIKIKPWIKSEKKLNDSKILLFPGVEMNDYVGYIDNFAHEMATQMFRSYIRWYWLLKTFRVKRGKNIFGVTSGTTRWKRKTVIHGLAGHSIKIFSGFHLGWLSKYVEHFFPLILKENVFEEDEKKYEYPYKHVTLEYLFFVHDMPQKFELLEKAEKEKMNYMVFANYAINFALCHNDECKRTIYKVACQDKTNYYIKSNY